MLAWFELYLIIITLWVCDVVALPQVVWVDWSGQNFVVFILQDDHAVLQNFMHGVRTVNSDVQLLLPGPLFHVLSPDSVTFLQMNHPPSLFMRSHLGLLPLADVLHCFVKNALSLLA